METSQLIARILGPFMVVAGAAMLVNPTRLRAMAKDFMDSPGLIFIAGTLALLLGLLLVNVHNVWVANWPVIITLYGWISVVAGILRMCFPDAVKSLGQRMIEKKGLIMGAAVINVLLGAFLIFKGLGY